MPGEVLVKLFISQLFTLLFILQYGPPYLKKLKNIPINNSNLYPKSTALSLPHTFVNASRHYKNNETTEKLIELMFVSLVSIACNKLS